MIGRSTPQSQWPETVATAETQPAQLTTMPGPVELMPTPMPPTGRDPGWVDEALAPRWHNLVFLALGGAAGAALHWIGWDNRAGAVVLLAGALVLAGAYEVEALRLRRAVAALAEQDERGAERLLPAPSRQALLDTARSAGLFLLALGAACALL